MQVKTTNGDVGLHPTSDTKSRGQYYMKQGNYTLFATRSNMADCNNVLSTIIRETANQQNLPV